MTTPAHPAAMEFLLARRSRPAKLLADPAPDREALAPILTAALRVPDHGKLEPWRLIVLEKPALRRLAAAAQARGEALGLEARDIDKVVAQYADSPLAVAVISAPKESPVPRIEQQHSAACVCLSLVNAALASGWGASWLTGWAIHDATFRREALDLAEGEEVAGVIHIGTARSAPPERPRPDVAALTTWLAE
ncbi:nitroreductase family protein [Pseudoroseicyclus aestuarii]|uniref:Putative NAD(P)H nitroreductase n=1 Tax=Pseudoroseicyclus aestuarii TaxID=1795041 RepID=A0A318SV60_9RHOB|nr:nitroreductase family protein [Pseudoroseicyclus aestuarii]PYE85382.1 nitroreductase [Pseudoroseicyclus aestuarii]